MIVENTDRSAVDVTLVSARDRLDPVWSQSSNELASSMLGSKENFEPVMKFNIEVCNWCVWETKEDWDERLIQVIRLNKICLILKL